MPNFNLDFWVISRNSKTKRMKKKLLLAIGIIGIGTLCSFAITQNNIGGLHGHGHDHKKMIEKKIAYLTQELSLTKEQQQKVEEISEKFSKKMMEMKKSSEDHAVMKESMMKMMMEAKTEISAILTEEQKAKFENLDFHKHHHGMHKEMHAKMEAIHDEMMPTITEKRTAFESKLSDDEKATIAEARTKMPSEEEMKTMKHDFMMKCKEECKGDYKKMHGDQKGHHDKADMHKRKEHHAEMKEKFKAEHPEIFAAIEPLDAIITNHETDLRAIFEEVKTEATSKMENLPAPAKEMLQKHEEEHFHMMAVHFLLHKPEATIEELVISTFPNPAVNNTTVSYDLKADQEVKISILNSEGVLLKEVFTGAQEKGKNELQVDLDNLKTTDFFIVQVEGNGIVGTQKILLKK